jgi:hypothetical protein
MQEEARNDGPREVQPVRFFDDPNKVSERIRDFSPKHIPQDVEDTPIPSPQTAGDQGEPIAPPVVTPPPGDKDAPSETEPTEPDPENPGAPTDEETGSTLAQPTTSTTEKYTEGDTKTKESTSSGQPSSSKGSTGSEKPFVVKKSSNKSGSSQAKDSKTE